MTTENNATAIKGDMLKLAEEIIAGRCINRQDDLSIFLTCDLQELCEGADKIRAACVGDKVDLCSIINGRSGKCPENCKFCAQSAHNHTDCQPHPFLPTEEFVAAAKLHEKEGVHRFSIVTAGRSLSGEEFDAAIEAYNAMSKESNIELCASMGFLNADQLHRLHETGVTSYHHNIETSRRFFPHICTTHTYDDRIRTIKAAQKEGLCVCSGGIIGMGETWEDRLDMAISLAELGIQSIPSTPSCPFPARPWNIGPSSTAATSCVRLLSSVSSTLKPTSAWQQAANSCRKTALRLSSAARRLPLRATC